MELVVNAFLIYSSPAIYRTTKKHHSFSKLRKKIIDTACIQEKNARQV